MPSATKHDVFVSYKREDRQRILPIVDGLRAFGLRVWFDAGLTPGRPFDTEIHNVLNEVKAVIVCWSTAAVQSDFVRAEATIGRSRRQLVAIQLEVCDLPPPFNIDHYEALGAWRGEATDQSWQKVLGRVGELCGRGLALQRWAQLQVDPTRARRREFIRDFPEDPLASGVRAAIFQNEIEATRVRLAREFGLSDAQLDQLSPTVEAGAVSQSLRQALGDERKLRLEAEEELERMRARWEAAQHVVDATATEFEARETALNDAKGELAKLREDLDLKAAVLSQTQENRDLLSKRNAAEIEQLRKTLATGEAELAHAKNSLRTQVERTEHLSEEIGILETEVVELRKNLNKKTTLEQDFVGLKVVLKEYEERLSAAKREALEAEEKLRKTISAKDEEIASLRVLVPQYELEIRERRKANTNPSNSVDKRAAEGERKREVKTHVGVLNEGSTAVEYQSQSGWDSFDDKKPTSSKNPKDSPEKPSESDTTAKPGLDTAYVLMYIVAGLFALAMMIRFW